MDITTKRKIKQVCLPAYTIYRKLFNAYCVRFAKQRIEKNYKRLFGRNIDWNNPQDLNEKINWLKFHADLKKWGMLADKYAVRKYVTDKGYSNILIPILGKWDNVDALLNDWNKLPDEFVLKSNNGCGHVIIITKENGGKKAINLSDLKREVTLWLRENDYGIQNAEFHYQYIKNCIIAEQYLNDNSISEFSKAPIDYKIYCANGKPLICYVSYGRTLTSKGEHKRIGDMYDLNWNQHSEYMTIDMPRRTLPKPEHWEEMLEIASVLSTDLTEVRVDLYNVSGKIYFGELTLTNASGFDTEYKPEVILRLGKAIKLNLKAPVNEYGKLFTWK